VTADQAGPPPFARIGIAGLGLIGGSLALAAKRAWPSALIVGVDRNDVLEDAQRAHAIDVAADDVGMFAGVDLVVLAAPVQANLTLLQQLPQVLDGEAVVTDVGSTKRAIVQAAARLPPRLTFVGGHPLAGAARAGLAYASPDLFQHRPWILTPTDDPAAVVACARLEQFVRAVGAEPRTMTAADHDRTAAWVSHLPQLTASALMRVIGDAVGAEGLTLSGRGLRDTTRLATSPPHVWVDICETNRDAIATALARLIDQLETLKSGLGTPATIEAVFEAAAAWRETLTHDSSQH
jgi:prephenate dehydrogenase